MATTSIWSASPINVTKPENAEVRTNYVKALKYKLSKSPCTYASEKLVLDPWKKWYGPHNVDRLHGSHEEWAKDQAWKVAFAIHILRFGPIFFTILLRMESAKLWHKLPKKSRNWCGPFFLEGGEGVWARRYDPKQKQKTKTKKNKTKHASARSKTTSYA